MDWLELAKTVATVIGTLVTVWGTYRIRLMFAGSKVRKEDVQTGRAEQKLSHEHIAFMLSESKKIFEQNRTYIAELKDDFRDLKLCFDELQVRYMDLQVSHAKCLAEHAATSSRLDDATARLETVEEELKVLKAKL